MGFRIRAELESNYTSHTGENYLTFPKLSFIYFLQKWDNSSFLTGLLLNCSGLKAFTWCQTEGAASIRMWSAQVTGETDSDRSSKGVFNYLTRDGWFQSWVVATVSSRVSWIHLFCHPQCYKVAATAQRHFFTWQCPSQAGSKGDSNKGTSSSFCS